VRLNPKMASAYSNLGNLLYSRRDFNGAIREYQEALKLEPNNADIHMNLGTALDVTGRTEEAITQYSQAIKLQPGNEKALVALCNSIQNGEDAGQTRHYVEQLQKQDQDRASYHLVFGIIDALETNLVAAESELNAAKRLDPKSSMVYVGLARLSEMHKNSKGADESFKTAVELAPLRSDARIEYAIFQARTGATNQARESLLELVRRAPDYLPPLVFLMQISSGLGKFDECNGYISQILAHDPGNHQALAMKGEVSLARKDGKQAVADFEHLIALYPIDPQASYQLGLAYLLNGNTAKALSSLSRSLQLDTNFSAAKLALSELNTQLGNSAAAIAMLTPLLKQTNLLQKDIVRANYILAQSYLVQKSPDQAIAIYRGLEASFPKDPQLAHDEGVAWRVANKPAEAGSHYRRSS